MKAVVKLAVLGFTYFLLFSLFEYINAVQMTRGSWKSIIRYGLKPQIIAFFALSPILVWGINKELYEGIGRRFWYMGIIMGFIEFVAYIVGSWIFYKHPPSVRESLAFLLMIAALIIGYEREAAR